MTTLQEIVTVMGGQDTLKLVNELSHSNDQFKSFEMFNISFRLIKTTEKNINLVIGAQITVEKAGDIDAFGMKAHKEIRTSFFKVISFFTQVNNQFEVTVLKEFEDEYAKLSSRLMPSKKLSLIENAVIAAFSKEAFYAAKKHKDTRIYVNGLQMDILMSFAGLPQSFLDDSYGVFGPIAVYEFGERFTEIRPMVQYTSMVENFQSMHLLTVFQK